MKFAFSAPKLNARVSNKRDVRSFYRTSEGATGKAPVPQRAEVSRIREGLEQMPIHHTQAGHGEGYHHGMDTTHGYAYYSPPMALMGQGCLSAAGQEIKNLKFKRALIVTDAVLEKLGATRPITDMLDSVGVKWTIFDGAEPNPTADQCVEGCNLLKSHGCDFVVSFGGGSPHDCAKMIATLATNGGKPQDYEGVNKLKTGMMPLVAINTTAGTAAEMTRFCIITDTSRHVKMAIIDAKVTPTLAVNDPNLMVAMPKSLTAATGMDALTHAIEAYVSTASTPVTDSAALHAIRLITAYLRDAVKNGSDIRARDMMAYAEYLAGMAFNNASLGYVHACAHQLGGFYNLPHGVCNAILLPVICEFNAKAVPELFIDIATAMGFNDVQDSTVAVKLVLDEIRKLSADVGIPRNLASFEIVKRADFETLAKNAMKDACGFTNPRKPTFEEVVGIYEKAYTQ